MIMSGTPLCTLGAWKKYLLCEGPASKADGQPSSIWDDNQPLSVEFGVRSEIRTYAAGVKGAAQLVRLRRFCGGPIGL